MSQEAGVGTAIVVAEDADRALEVIRSRPEGAEAARIGEVSPSRREWSSSATAFGGTSVIDMLIGAPLPSIR